MSRNERLYYHEDLVEAGVRLSRSRLAELRRQGKFPQPIIVGERRLAWRQSDLDKYLAARPRADARPAPTALTVRRASGSENPGGLRVFGACA